MQSKSQTNSSDTLAEAGPPVSVVILTRDEEINIEDCLRSCAWCDDIHILDSGSSDRTCEIAIRLGATVHVHPFTSFGEQRNWAIDHIRHKHDWVFHLDADERFSPELVGEIQQVLAGHPDEAGFYVPHKLMFMGRWLRYAEGGYPIYQMRLFHKARMRFRDYGHGQREATSGRISVIRQPYLHYNFSKGISDWLARHDLYSTREAARLLAGDEEDRSGRIASWRVRLRRFLKSRVYPRLPARWLIRFIWTYFLRGGFLDGRPGLVYCQLMSVYEVLISAKVAESRSMALRADDRTAIGVESPASPKAHSV